MKILCIDTSSKLCSTAILENTTLLSKIELNNGLTHSETLIPLINKILTENSLTLKDINLIVCDIGPGSFTGIRIGIATAKAFSDSLNIPTIGISSLEALAYNIKNDGIICSMIDCKNSNCYFAIYNLKDNIYTLLDNPCANSLDNCIKLLNYKYSDSKITFVGDACINYHEFIVNNIKNSNISFADTSLNTINPFELGIAGINKFNNNNNQSENILPLYLKKPQAQRQLESKNINISEMSINDLDNFCISEFDDFWNIETLKSELNSMDSKFIIAKMDNYIVGFAVIKKVLDEADIMNIAVHKNFRHQGIGSILLSSLINLSQNMQIKKINLEVNENNFPAISLYKKFKFNEIGRRKNYYDNQYDAILMSLY